MTFEQLSTHSQIKGVLQKSIQDGRIPHAQFFQGVDGGGNLPLAIAYAQELLAGEADMFGGTDERASRLEHPDLHIVFPMVQAVDKTCDSLVNEFREEYNRNPFLSYEQWVRIRDEKSKKAIISKHEALAISKKMTLRSFEGGYKVLLIWMPELMNPECANKLLKLIEEPPPSSVILMVGNDIESLLPTIRSRVQLIPLPLLSSDEVLQNLKASRTEEESVLQVAANNAGGSIANAIDDLLDKEHTDDNEIISWLRICYQRKVPDVMTWCDGRASEGREGVARLLRNALDIFRMAFIKNYSSATMSSSANLETFTGKFSPFIHTQNVEELMETIDKGLADVRRNGNPRIVLLDMSFKMMRTLRIPAEPKSEEA